jgi:hypothetical protein
MSHGRAIAIIVAASLLLCVATSAVAQRADYRPVVLGQGKIGRFHWGVTVARDSGTRGGQRPCVVVSLRDTKPKYYPPGQTSQSYSSVCSALGLQKAPNIVSANSGSGAAERTVAGMSFAPSIDVVSLDFGAKGQRKLRLKLLNAKQARIAGVRRMRYGTVTFAGSFCLRQVIGYDQTGKEVYRGPAESCEAE